MSLEIPISALRPSSLTSTAIIRGVITLVWPYSQSTQTCAILLAAEDFRLRCQRGQVRITFSGAAARAVAESKAGISDTLVVSLRGARWHDSADVQTPGKSVDGELGFKNVLELNVLCGSGRTKEVSICVSSPVSHAIEQQNANYSIPTTPPLAAWRPTEAIKPSNTVKDVFGSPAFLKKAHSTTHFNSDPFFDIGEEEQPKKRMRMSLGEVRDWRYVRQPSSPRSGGNHAMQDDISTSDIQRSAPIHSQITALDDRPPSEETGGTLLAPSSAAVGMHSPPLPQLLVSGISSDTSVKPTNAEDPTPTTPKLYPVPASALPLPSPFPDETMQAHFDPVIKSVESSDAQAQGSSTLHGDMKPSQQALDQPDETTAQVLKPENASAVESPIDHTVFRDENAPVSQDLCERERSRKQVLSSLFGFQPSPMATTQNHSTQESRDNGCTLSDFEIAESQVMDQVVPFDDNARDLSSTAGTEATDQVIEGTPSLQIASVILNDLNKDGTRLRPIQSTTEAVHSLSEAAGQPDTSYSIESQLAVDSTPKNDAPAFSVGEKEMTQVCDPLMGKHTVEQTTEEKIVDRSLAALRQSQGTATTTPLFDENEVQVMDHTRLPQRDLFQEESDELNQVSDCDREKLSKHGDPRSSRHAIDRSRSRTAAIPTRGDPKAPFLTSSDQIPTRGQPVTFPQVLRKWMSPRLSVKYSKTANNVVALAVGTGTERQLSPPSMRAGLQTSFSYFAALRRLREYVNVAGGNRVDVIGMVLSSSRRDRREGDVSVEAYVVMQIIDDTLPEGTTVPVNIWRRHSTFLPTAAFGDMILLRNFTVKSRNHRQHLQSGDESAWCVWRYSELYDDSVELAADGEKNQPPGRPLPVQEVVREDIHGPPVEYGEEERHEVKRLNRALVSPNGTRIASTAIAEVSPLRENQVFQPGQTPAEDEAASD